MNSDPTPTMSPDEEHAFYAAPEHQLPAGPPVRRKARMGAPVPIRFPEDLLDEVKERAAADDRTVSSWIRRAVERELHRTSR